MRYQLVLLDVLFMVEDVIFSHNFATALQCRNYMNQLCWWNIQQKFANNNRKCYEGRIHGDPQCVRILFVWNEIIVILYSPEWGEQWLQQTQLRQSEEPQGHGYAEKDISYFKKMLLQPKTPSKTWLVYGNRHPNNSLVNKLHET